MIFLNKEYRIVPNLRPPPNYRPPPIFPAETAKNFHSFLLKFKKDPQFIEDLAISF